MEADQSSPIESVHYQYSIIFSIGSTFPLAIDILYDFLFAKVDTIYLRHGLFTRMFLLVGMMLTNIGLFYCSYHHQEFSSYWNINNIQILVLFTAILGLIHDNVSMVWTRKRIIALYILILLFIVFRILDGRLFNFRSLLGATSATSFLLGFMVAICYSTTGFRRYLVRYEHELFSFEALYALASIIIIITIFFFHLITLIYFRNQKVSNPSLVSLIASSSSRTVVLSVFCLLHSWRAKTEGSLYQVKRIGSLQLNSFLILILSMGHVAPSLNCDYVRLKRLCGTPSSVTYHTSCAPLSTLFTWDCNSCSQTAPYQPIDRYLNS